MSDLTASRSISKVHPLVNDRWLRSSIAGYVPASFVLLTVLFVAGTQLNGWAPEATREAETSAGNLLSRTEQHLVEREKLAEELGILAKDESLPGAERGRAVMLLSRLDTELGRKFMLNNLTMRVSVGRAKLDDELARRYPCEYYLIAQDHRNWNTGRTMLAMLDEEIPKHNLVSYAAILRNVFRSAGAELLPRAMLKYELTLDPKEPRKRQLVYVLDQLGN